jgi:Sensors of blue-light using FAD
MPLNQLIYCSRIAIPAADMADSMACLLVAATARNKQNDVTGCLAYCTEWFIQVIEGSEPAVKETFDRIALDPRHTGVRIINQRDIRGRSFPDWAMAGIKLFEQPQALLDSYGLGDNFDPEKVLGSQLLLLLMALADRRRMAK